MNTVARSAPKQVQPRSLQDHSQLYLLSHHSLMQPAMQPPVRAGHKPANKLPESKYAGRPTIAPTIKPAMMCLITSFMSYLLYCQSKRFNRGVIIPL